MSIRPTRQHGPAARELQRAKPGRRHATSARRPESSDTRRTAAGTRPAGAKHSARSASTTRDRRVSGAAAHPADRRARKIDTPASSAGRARPSSRIRAPRPLQRKPLRPPSHRHASLWRAGRPRRRLLTIFAVVAIAFVALIARVALVQTVDSDQFVALGELQRTRNEVLIADRGAIFDRNGEELAISIPATTFWANPRLITDPTGTAAALAQMLQMTAEEEKNLAVSLSKDKQFVYVARQLDDGQAQVIEDMRLPGIGWYTEPKRVAPAGVLARGVVGRTDIDGLGISGLEAQFDDVLTGTPGSYAREVDEGGRSIPNGKQELVAPVPGEDLGPHHLPSDPIPGRGSPARQGERTRRSQAPRRHGHQGLASCSHGERAP
ncbi:MAG: hypothetical protein R2705_04115 [Ilumatobacteraceae bacterium]